MSSLAPKMTSALTGPREGRDKTKLLVNQGTVTMTGSCGLIIRIWLQIRGTHPVCFRYLNFYKKTMDLLTMNSIISLQEVTLPIVSAAISHLWQTLSEEKKASVLQVWEQQQSSFSELTEACLELAYAEDSMKDSGVDSQGASCSLESTPEEVSRPCGAQLCLDVLGASQQVTHERACVCEDDERLPLRGLI